MNTQSERMMRRWRERHPTEPTQAQIDAAAQVKPWGPYDRIDPRRRRTDELVLAYRNATIEHCARVAEDTAAPGNWGTDRGAEIAAAIRALKAK
jgi:hypothetical protein